jgi:hypothetical protein
MARAATGRITLARDGEVFWRSRRATFMPHRRLSLTRDLPDLSRTEALHVGFDEG